MTIAVFPTRESVSGKLKFDMIECLSDWRTKMKEEMSDAFQEIDFSHVA